MLAKQPDAYRQQDGQALFSPSADRDPHPEWRWRRRAPDGLEDRHIRAAWREAEPVEWPGDDYARYHDESGMLLIAELGFIQTVVRVDDVQTDDELAAYREYKEGMLDGE